MAEESEGKPLDPEVAWNQTLKAQPEEKVQISTSEPLFMSSSEPMLKEEYTDFSDLQLLVAAAVQKAAELELQEK